MKLQFLTWQNAQQTAIDQWQNSRGQSAPPRLLTGKFLLTYREKRGKKKGENGEEKKENRKGKVEN